MNYLKMYNTDISVRLQKIDIMDTSKLDILYVLTSNIISKIFITNTALGINTGILEICVVFWVKHNDDLIYAVTSYKMGTFESLYDEQWMFDVSENDEYTHAYGNKRKRYFDSISPKRPELDKLLTLNPTYYKFDYSIVEEVKDELCEIEQEFIKVWSRDCKLKQIQSGISPTIIMIGNLNSEPETFKFKFFSSVVYVYMMQKMEPYVEYYLDKIEESIISGKNESDVKICFPL